MAYLSSTAMLMVGVIILCSITSLHGTSLSNEELLKLQLAKRLLTKPSEGKADKRPNIVFVICDAMDGRLVGRDDLVQMPNINHLAKNGVNFMNAYTNSPICVPSRSALWSGRHTHITESWNNYKGLPKDYPTWAVLLEQAGYKTKDGRLVGRDDLVQMPNINHLAKNGVNFMNAYTNSPICVPSRSALWSGRHTHITESWNNYKGLPKDYPTWAVLLEQAGYKTKVYGDTYYVSGHHTLREAGYKTKIYGKTDYESGHHSLSNRMEAWTRNVNFTLTQEGRPTPLLIGDKTTTKVSPDWLLLPNITEWIQTNATSSSQPFLLYIGFTLPHPYKTQSSGKAAGGSTFKTSPYWLQKVNQLEVAATMPTWIPLDQMHPVDYYETATKNCTSDFSKSEIHNIRAYYYAMCAETDAMLGEVMDALNTKDLLQDSYVFFTADHGDLAMDHRQFYKMSMYEGSSHVPLVAMAPARDHRKPGYVRTPVSLVDVFPTFMDIANISYPQGLNGTSLLPLLREPTSSRHLQARPDYILSQYHGCNVNMSTYMLRQGDWKLVVYGDGKTTPPNLFNVATDPEELDDLVNKESDQVKEMEQLLSSIINYPHVTAKVKDYNKKSFTDWKESVGSKYSEKLANLRWWKDWQKAPKEYENKIDEWLNS